MASLKTYIDSPLFTTGAEISATELNIIRENAEAVKYAALRPAHVLDISRFISVQNNKRIWRGGFQYRTGLTTARFIIYTKQVSGEGEHDVVIRFDGTEVARYDAAITGLNVGGYQTTDITINTRGYTDFQIITVEITIDARAGGGTDDSLKVIQYVFDAYTLPHSSISAGTWPGKPTFGAITSTRLNQLSNGLDYLANRLNNVPMPLSMNVLNYLGTSNARFPKFRYFRVLFSNQNRRFKTSLYYINHHTTSYIRLTIGSVVWDFGPYTLDQKSQVVIDVDGIAAGLSFDVPYFASLEEYVTSPVSSSDGHGGFLFSRIWNGPLMTTANSYTYTAIGASNAVLETITYADLKSRLNNIATIMDEAHTTITTQTNVFDHGSMFRSRFGIDDGMDQYFAPTLLAGKFREGDVLWVKGQDLKLGYGTFTVQPKVDDKPNDVWEYKFQFEETLIDTSGLQQSYFYLDQFENLNPGMLYYITGKDIHYAAEALR